MLKRQMYGRAGVECSVLAYCPSRSSAAKGCTKIEPQPITVRTRFVFTSSRIHPTIATLNGLVLNTVNVAVQVNGRMRGTRIGRRNSVPTADCMAIKIRLVFASEPT
jgi:hypothetical protein